MRFVDGSTRFIFVAMMYSVLHGVTGFYFFLSSLALMFLIVELSNSHFEMCLLSSTLWALCNPSCPAKILSLTLASSHHSCTLNCSALSSPLSFCSRLVCATEKLLHFKNLKCLFDSRVCGFLFTIQIMSLKKSNNCDLKLDSS